MTTSASLIPPRKMLRNSVSGRASCTSEESNRSFCRIGYDRAIKMQFALKLLVVYPRLLSSCQLHSANRIDFTEKPRIHSDSPPLKRLQPPE